MSEQKTIYKTYKYRLYPNKTQEAIFEEWLETCRRLYNYCVQQRYDNWTKGKETREKRQPVTRFGQIKQLAEMRTINQYLHSAYAHVLQDVVNRVDHTFVRFYEERAKGNKTWGKPKFKKKKEYNSFTYNEYSNGHRFRIRGNKLFLGKISFVKVVIDRPIPENAIIRTCTIKRDCKHWYALIMFIYTKTLEPITNLQKAIGIDMGLRTYGVLSNGERIENPEWIGKYEKKLAHEQRRLSRKIKRSSNWKKQCVKLAKIYQKLRFQRVDFLHKQTTKLANVYNIIALEDLRINEMMENQRLSKCIREVSWWTFRHFLKHKTEILGKKLVIVSPHNTSQNCSRCGKKVDKSIEERIHNCPYCGLMLDRDENAAINILKRGLGKLWSSNDNTAGLAESACGETSVEAQGSKKTINAI